MGALAVAFLVLLSILALTVRQPPPPTIAEFAPQAVEQISDTSDDYLGRGRSAATEPTPRPGEASPSPDVAIDVPRVRKCVGDPPRQTEDPQSPPCVPYWTGENGGATWRGVTRDQIKIAVPNTISNDANPDFVRWQTALQAFLNKRFELYGRKLTFKKVVTSKNACAGADQTAVRAEAVRVAEEYGAFASTLTCSLQGAFQAYYDELARRQVLSMSAYTSSVFERDVAEWDPYQWNYFPQLDVVEEHLADWMCRSLGGRPPRYSTQGEASRVTGAKRAFGVMYTSRNGYDPPSIEPLRERLGRCGVRIVATAEAGSEATDATIETAVLRMQEAGATSVLCLCAVVATGVIMDRATQHGFFPEWLVSSYGEQDWDVLTQIYWPANQSAHAFGLMFHNRFLDISEMPWAWAIREMDPGYSFGERNEKNGTEIVDYYNEIGSQYASMLMLVSGIQLAGPHLTPQTFKKGLQQARFPNPGAGGPPYFQARMHLGSGHTMIRDAAVMWYSTSQKSYDGGTGTFCYFRRGARFELGGYPASDDGYFDPASCR